MSFMFTATYGESESSTPMCAMGEPSGPMLNERLDYFGQTVNIAARVQGLCQSRSIFATRPVVEEPQAARLLSAMGVTPVAQSTHLRGISDALTVYEIA